MQGHIHESLEIRNPANYIKAKQNVSACSRVNGITYLYGTQITEEEYKNLFYFDNLSTQKKDQLKTNVDGTSKWLHP